MSNNKPLGLEEIKDFLLFPQSIQFKSISKKERNTWIQGVIMHHRYLKCARPVKSLLRQYIMRMTGLSRSQLTRLVRNYKSRATLKPKEYKRNKFASIYTKGDIELLADTDNAHECLSGPATICIMKDEYDIYDKEKYIRLKNISVSHLYRLRSTPRYRENVQTFSKTKPTKVTIGERVKPEPNGKPGYLCVDTVHQGDKDSEKGVYHINCVDMVTQFEFVGAVESISERFMEDVLIDLLKQFPFKVIEFHSDNGSEYINKVVAKLLNKLMIKLTKTRPRRSNDNALAETKNGAIIRKHMGYIHIPRKKAGLVNQFYQEYFNTYLNYYRPCGFAEMRIDKRGKEKKIYPKEGYMTPYNKLKSLNNAKLYLKEFITFEELNKIFAQRSSTEYAKIIQKEKRKLFKILLTNN